MIDRFRRHVAAEDAFELGGDEERDVAAHFTMPPRLAVRPRDAAQCAAVLREAAELGAAVVPWGGGRHQDVGNVPRPVEVLLVTTAMAGIVEYDAADQTVIVGAGTRLVDLAERIRGDRLMLPLDPDGLGRATLGGVIAANRSGPLRAGYGTPRDCALGTRTAHSDGTVAKSGGRLVKNVTGFDLHRLYCGSLGTLAVVCEASLRLRPLPEREASCVIACAGAEEVDDLLARLRAGGEDPAACLVLGGGALALTASAGSSANAAGAPLPDRAERGFVVLARFHGFEPAVARALARLADDAAASGASRVEHVEGAQHAALWDSAREARARLDPRATGAELKLCLPSYAAEAGGRTRRATCRVGAALDAVAAACAGAGVEPALIAEPVLGIVRAVLSEPPPEALLASLAALATAQGGRLTIESAPAAWRAGRDVYLGRMANAVRMARLKKALDPGGVLSPGRITYAGRGDEASGIGGAA